jgi:hypothetical protein
MVESLKFFDKFLSINKIWTLMKETLTRYSKAITQTTVALTLAASIYVGKDTSEDIVPIEDTKDNSPPVTRQTISPPLNTILQIRGIVFDPLEFSKINFSSKEIPITQVPTPIQNRTDCDSIRGTEYNSPEEREFFHDNCIINETPKQLHSAPKSMFGPRPPSEWADVVCTPDFTWDCGWAV